MSATFGYSSEQRVAQNAALIRTKSSAVLALDRYKSIVDAYEKKGPQGFLDAMGAKLDEKDRGFVVGILQSKNQEFQHLPGVEFSNDGMEMKIKESAKRTWKVKVLDANSSTFEVNGVPFQINYDQSFEINYKTVKDAMTASLYLGQKTALHKAPNKNLSYFAQLKNNAFSSLSSLFLPQAKADFTLDTTTMVIIGVVVLALMALVYFWGKSNGASSQSSVDAAASSAAAITNGNNTGVVFNGNSGSNSGSPSINNTNSNINTTSATLTHN